MEPLRYRNLTGKQRLFICNGCGAKGGPFNPPDFRFTASCNHHDFNYWLGFREEDRIKADRQFYAAMKSDVEKYRWWKRPVFYLTAWTYFRAVRFFGGKFFHYGDRERNITDLIEAMNKAGVS